MKRNRFRLTLYGLLTAGMMCGIFLFSSQNGTESGRLSRWLMETAFGQFLLRILPPLTGSGAALDIRKYAHLTEYALLAVFALLFFAELLLEWRPKRAVLWALGFCFLYACTDEFHQTLIPGRAGQFTDVLVDTGGVILGILLVCLIRTLRKERK